MEEVAVIAPPVVHNDDLSDESMILNLQVSDNEECDEDKIKKTIGDETAINGKVLLPETEEDILNKYVADSPSSDDKKIDEDLLDSSETSEVKCNGLGDDDEELVENSVDDSKVATDVEKGKVNKDEDVVEDADPKTNDVEGDVPNETPENMEGVESVSAVVTDILELQFVDSKPEGLCNGLPDDVKIATASKETVVDKDVCRIESKKENEESEGGTKKPSSVKDAEESSGETIPTSSKDGEEKTDDAEDGEDLLQVMEEKSIEEAEQENKDENSCSSSDKDEEQKVPAVEETGDDNNESQVDADEAGECPMDIEENDIGVIFSEHNTSKELDATKSPDKIALRRGSSVNNMDIGENEITNEKENVIDENINDPAMNKENEKPVDAKVGDSSISEDTANTEVLANGGDAEIHEDKKVEPITPPPEDVPKKSNKRQLSPVDDTDHAKKIKLDGVTKTETETETAPVEKRELIKLNGFKQFMLDKQLEKLTRYELEELCLQKMCECIVNKSEIGDLRQKVKVQEQAIDTWRKEAVVVAKQTRDLKIVHERLVADLKAMKEQAGKPLVPVKITRSVGLQAYIENTFRQRNQSVVNGTTPRSSPTSTPAKTTTPSRQQIKTKGTTQRIVNKPLQPVQKDNVNTPKHRAIQPAKKNADPKAVIDLTDEDEKNQTAKPNTTQSATPTFRVISKPTSNNNTKVTNVVTSSAPQKIMIMAPNVLARSGSAVMLKVNSNGVVSQPNGIITSMANGQVSVVQPQATVRTVQARVSSVPTPAIRPATAKPSFKHPAPLPPAPSSQLNIVARKPVPPRPHLNLTRSNCGTGIVLQWKMPYKLDVYENIVSYQLYAYQETKSPPRTDNWGKIGDVKALELPMAVTLTQFAVGNRYFFAVRAVDALKRLGPFSEPQTILL